MMPIDGADEQVTAPARATSGKAVFSWPAPQWFPTSIAGSGSFVRRHEERGRWALPATEFTILPGYKNKI